MNKKRTILFAAAVAGIGTVFLWLIVDIFLNGKIREFTYNELLEHFSQGWESLRLFFYFVFAIMLFVVVIIYILIPQIYIEKIKKSETKKIKRLIIDFFENNSFNSIDPDYSDLKEILLAQKLRLDESEIKRNEMISNIAHDLKTPLTSILGYLMLLNDEEELPKNIRKKYTRISVEKAEQLNTLVSEFFELSQYTFEDVSIVKSEIDINQLIEQLIDEFYPVLKETNHEIVFQSQSNLRISADGNKICRALENIIKNAIYHSIPQTTIEIRLENLKNQATIKVSNESDYISTNQLSKLFERSYRIDESRNFNGNGGLGLPIAKKIVEAHSGQIHASYIEGTFTVTIEI